jgi:hypothetical protein
VASFHALYIDVDRGEPVASASDPSIATLPKWVQQDTVPLRITLLSNFSRATGRYTPLPTAGLTLEVALGVKIGNASLLFSQQFSWSESDDLADPYFEGSLPMNTPAIATLLGSGAQASAWFEVKMLDGGLPRTVLLKPVTIHAAVIKDGALEAAADPTPISAETCLALFLQRTIPCSSGNPIILKNGSITMALYVDDLGEFQTVRLT